MGAVLYNWCVRDKWELYSITGALGINGELYSITGAAKSSSASLNYYHDWGHNVCL